MISVLRFGQEISTTKMLFEYFETKCWRVGTDVFSYSLCVLSQVIKPKQPVDLSDIAATDC